MIHLIYTHTHAHTHPHTHTPTHTHTHWPLPNLIQGATPTQPRTSETHHKLIRPIERQTNVHTQAAVLSTIQLQAVHVQYIVHVHVHVGPWVWRRCESAHRGSTTCRCNLAQSKHTHTVDTSTQPPRSKHQDWTKVHTHKAAQQPRVINMNIAFRYCV